MQIRGCMGLPRTAQGLMQIRRCMTRADQAVQRFGMAEPRKAQESLGELRRAQETPGELRRTEESPGELRRAQEKPGGARGAQESPGEPRRAQESPRNARRAQEIPFQRLGEPSSTAFALQPLSLRI